MSEITNKHSEFLDKAEHLVEHLLQERDFKQIVRFYEENAALLRNQSGSGLSTVLFCVARSYAETAELQKALQCARQAETELSRQGETAQLARLYLIIGGVLRDMGKLHESERSFRDAESISRRIDNQEVRANALNRLAQLCFMRSEMSQAISFLRDSLEIAKARNDIRRMAFLYGNLGRVQSFIGDSGDAVENLRMNIRLSGQCGDYLEVIKAKLSLGYEHTRLGALSASEELFTEVERELADRSAPREEAILSVYRAELLVKQRRFDLAGAELANARRISERLSSASDLAGRVRRGLAELALAENEWRRALKLAKNAESIFEKLGEKIDIGVLCRIQAEALYQIDSEGNREAVIALLHRSLDLLESAHAKVELAVTLEWIGSVDLYDSHRRLAYLFRAEAIYAERRDRRGAERVSRFIADAPPFTGAYQVAEVDDEKQDPVTMRPENPEYTYLTDSPRVQKILSQLSLIRTSDLPILLTGETGVGKGRLARHYHELVNPGRPFVALNVTNVPETLLESELFGHAKGAYTDAVSSTDGLLVAANGGTLFLDEIGEMPPSLQMRLLNVIEEKQFRPLGSTEVVHVDFILITATNRNLKEMVEQREFRRDLYHRLDGFAFEIPALRDRKEDIPLLLRYFLQKYGLLADGQEIDPELKRRFVSHSWPGNVRELENSVKRMKAFSTLVKAGSLLELVESSLDSREEIETADLFGQVERFERELILEALIVSNWNKSEAARQLKVHESTLRAKMKRYQLEKPTDPAGGANVRLAG